MTGDPLLRILRDPHAIASLSTSEWDLLLRLARGERLLAKLGVIFEELELEQQCPVQFIDNALGERARARYLQLLIHRELTEVEKAVKDIEVPILLLKGAAYLESGLPPTRGRSLSDLDILVPRDRITLIEDRLKESGWKSDTEDEYDQRYYREWMHEIPPLKHPSRGVEVDIHHNLLPLTGRLKVNAELLWEKARPISGSGLLTLSSSDMVLHSATHLFFSDELRGGLRDLVDITELCRYFSDTEEGFYPRLLERSHQLGLSRPLYYALISARELLHLPLPDRYLTEKQFDTPGLLTGRLIKFLFSRVLSPHHPEGRGAPVSEWLLFVRSHLIRMPPAMLAGHLFKKSIRRAKAT